MDRSMERSQGKMLKKKRRQSHEQSCLSPGLSTSSVLPLGCILCCWQGYNLGFTRKFTQELGTTGSCL
jgi:hypothetical protein